MTSNDKPGILFTLALLIEVVGIVLLVGPVGSSLTNMEWGNWLAGWAVICGAMLLAPWALRWLGGPKPWRLFSRGTSYKLIQLLYLGLLFGIVIAAYKAVLCLMLRVHGIPFDALLTSWRLYGSDSAFLPAVVLSLTGAYFTFGYIQGLVARVFEERGGMLVAALLFALGSTWPFDHFAGEVVGIPRWVFLAALYLPVGTGLAYLSTRTRSALPVLTAVLVISWLSGLASAVHSTLGALVTALVMTIMLLVGLEIIIGERRRAKRFITGFFKDITAKEEGGLPDALIFVMAVTGLLFTAWASEMFYAEWYIFLVIPVCLIIISTTLWVIYIIIRRKRVNETDGKSE